MLEVLFLDIRCELGLYHRLLLFLNREISKQFILIEIFIE